MRVRLSALASKSVCPCEQTCLLLRADRILPTPFLGPKGSSTRAGFFRPLRVSPSTPAGPVPSRRHPWGSTLQRFLHFLSRPPFGEPCPSFPWPRSSGFRVARLPWFDLLPRVLGPVHSARTYPCGDAAFPRGDAGCGSFVGCWLGLPPIDPRTNGTSKALPVRLSSRLRRSRSRSALSRAGIQGLEPRMRAWSRGGIQPLAWTRTSLGFPALQGLTKWTVRWISPAAPLSLLAVPRRSYRSLRVSTSPLRSRAFTTVLRPCGSRTLLPLPASPSWASYPRAATWRFGLGPFGLLSGF